MEAQLFSWGKVYLTSIDQLDSLKFAASMDL